MMPAPARAVPTVGDLHLLVVLADFPDRPLTQPRTYFTGAPDALVDRMVAYWTEVSSGRLRIVPHVATTTITLPRPRAGYVQQAPAMATDALHVFAAEAHDPADVEALRSADGAVVFFAGSGRESHTQGGDPGDPWSNFVKLQPAVEGVEDACLIAAEEVPPFSPFGVLCHEFGHLLGLPELYAPGAARHEGIGVWGLMGQGTWVGRGADPPELDAWSKLQLGWVDVDVIERTTYRVRLPAVEREPRVVKIPAVPGRPQEYYLLENRQRIGADAKLAGDGILVWHVDEGVAGFRTAQMRPEHKLLHLVEADGRGDLDLGHAAGGNRGDASDPWWGPPRWQRTVGAFLALLGACFVAMAIFRVARPRALVPVLLRLVLAAGALYGGNLLRQGPVCGPGTPGMAPYGGEPTRVTLRNFSPSGAEMTVDVLIARDDVAP
ncbi:MAG TPA: M6 family metalloprotease domain-containing protein [Candidatus Binatia bacterium]|jgi:immune inhibitor A|nr:M6 family metalloprotease domain-containing protein [Candidatus Binatia bacterium]